MKKPRFFWPLVLVYGTVFGFMIGQERANAGDGILWGLAAGLLWASIFTPLFDRWWRQEHGR